MIVSQIQYGYWSVPLIEFNIPNHTQKLINDIDLKKTIKSKNNNIHKVIFSKRNISGNYEACSFYNKAADICDICVSCMAGCTMKCKFCAASYTKQPDGRKLNSHEILAQISIMLDNRLENLTPNTSLKLGAMGNGEPFDNLENVLNGFYAFSKISPLPINCFNFSTIGLLNIRLDSLKKLSEKTHVPVKLQYSLYTLDDSLRKKLIPEGDRIKNVVKKLDLFAKETGFPVKYNIPLIKGINDNKDQLNEIANFILEKPTLRKLKLSYYNTFPDSPFQNCSDEELLLAKKFLLPLGINIKVFFGDRDNEVFATCGLMRIKTEKQTKTKGY